MTQKISPLDMGDRLQTADVSKLTYELEKSKKKTKLLKQAIWGLAVLIGIAAICSYYFLVLSYASIEGLKITQSSSDPTKVQFNFTVTSDGFLEYGHQTSVLGEPVKKGDKRDFTRQREVDPSKNEYVVFVRSRSGIFPLWTTQTFQTRPSK